MEDKAQSEQVALFICGQDTGSVQLNLAVGGILQE